MFSQWTPDVIFVNNDLWNVEKFPELNGMTDAQKENFKNQIITHELTHFLDFHYGWTGMDSCGTEELAFKVANTWGLEFGGWLAWQWKTWYRC